jgi:acyl carrier protein
MGLETVELAMMVEDEFGITVPDLEMERARTMGDLYDLVLRLTQNTRSARLRQREDLDQHVWDRLAKFVAELGDVPVETIQRSTRFIEDLGYG